MHFACQHLYKLVPPITTHPNWKVDPFLKHLNGVFIQAAVLPKRLSVDEQTIMFHGDSKLKACINTKKWVIYFSVIPFVQMETLSPSFFVISLIQKIH